MSAPDSDPLEVVRRAFDLYGAGEYAALFELAHPEVEVDPAFMPGVYRGLPSVRAMFEQMGDPRRLWSASELEFAAVDGMVIASGRLRSATSLGGVLDLPIAFLFVLRDRKIAAVKGHMTKAEALRSASSRVLGA